jgi:hypothetical protein
MSQPTGPLKWYAGGVSWWLVDDNNVTYDHLMIIIGADKFIVKSTYGRKELAVCDTLDAAKAYYLLQRDNYMVED